MSHATHRILFSSFCTESQGLRGHPWLSSSFLKQPTERVANHAGGTPTARSNPLPCDRKASERPPCSTSLSVLEWITLLTSAASVSDRPAVQPLDSTAGWRGHPVETRCRTVRDPRVSNGEGYLPSECLTGPAGRRPPRLAGLWAGSTIAATLASVDPARSTASCRHLLLRTTPGKP